MQTQGSNADVMPRDAVSEAVVRILVESLGVDEDAIVPEAALVNDLGAESIDFLDIAFRLEEDLGVRMPMKEWAKAAENDAALTPERLALRLGRVFGIPLAVEDAASILGEDGAAEGLLSAIARRFGYVLTAQEAERLRAAADPTLAVKEFAARQIELFTVQSLENFVRATLAGGAAAPAAASGE
jgi:acyl carrier protein